MCDDDELDDESSSSDPSVLLVIVSVLPSSDCRSPVNRIAFDGSLIAFSTRPLLSNSAKRRFE